MSGKLRDRIEYSMLCVDKFAHAMGLSVPQACEYLHSHKGLEFLDACYEVESAFSPRIVVEDLRAVCLRNGGTLS